MLDLCLEPHVCRRKLHIDYSPRATLPGMPESQIQHMYTRRELCRANWHFQATENHIFRLIRTDWAKIEARSGNPDILDDKARKPDPNPDIRVTNCPDIFADI